MPATLKNKNEHLSCGYYQHGDGAIIDTIDLKQGEKITRELTTPKIVFVRKGRCRVSFNKVTDREVRSGDIFLLPPLANLLARIEEDTQALVFKLNADIKLCNTYSLENLHDENIKPVDENMYILSANDRISRFIDLMSDCISDGIRCSNYLKIKTTEIMYYFRIYYTKEELSRFFAPILTGDSMFANFVYRNFKKVKTAQELSDLYGYSQSSFEKQFKKVFGVSTYQWMVDRKAKLIYHKLTCSEKNFTEIADEFDFSSSSRFCDFCKQYLGASPKEIRQNKVCKI